jgi:hypothetical protein
MIAFGLERFPVRWNHLTIKKSWQTDKPDLHFDLIKMKTGLSSDSFRKVVIGAAALLLLILLLVFFIGGNDKAPEKQPKLGLMTTLPLYWGEGNVEDMVQQASAPLPAYQRLDERYDIRLIDAVDAKNLQSVHMLLLAQSRALAPEELVRLDSWVRSGGHLMILADPALQWESEYPLGDKRRPLFTSLLSPLFAHWGLELVLPLSDDERPEVIKQISGQSIRTVTPGAWQSLGKSKDAGCKLTDGALVAKCKVGKGSAILIADADILNADLWSGSGVRSLSGADDFDNMSWIESNLERLWRHGVS